MKIAIAAALAASTLTPPAQSAEFKNGLELLIACTPGSPQPLFNSCLDAIVNRVSALSARGIKTCPTPINDDESFARWAFYGHRAVVNYWEKYGTPADAAKLSPDAVIDAPLRMLGYQVCIDSTAS